jgi:hypothetical protein
VDFSVNTSSTSLDAWRQYFVDNPSYQGTLPGASEPSGGAVPGTVSSAVAARPAEAPGTTNLTSNDPGEQLPADTPEAPFALLLPLAGLTLLGVAYRRRGRRSGDTARVALRGGDPGRRARLPLRNPDDRVPARPDPSRSRSSSPGGGRDRGTRQPERDRWAGSARCR